ncbi:MAG: long-chain fatty acid--CoA ligase, partial [Treponema sp.]|nr:long-chain fatty acid--CoA ligase [Treponema sp.]
MKSLKNYDPTQILKPYKGKLYNGEWPTLPELFKVSLARVPNNACFTDFEGPGGARNALTYTQVVNKIELLA